MEKIIQDLPNNAVCIICSIKPIDENHNNYAIIPQGLAFGRVDEYGYFLCEDTGERISSVSSFDDSKIDEEKKYFFNPITFEELKERYKEKENNVELAAISYYREYQDNIIFMYKNNKGDEPIVDTIVKKKDLSGKNVSPLIKSSNRVAPKVDNDLANIKRKELASYLKERILDNDSIMDDIATVIVANFRTTNPRLMKNMLCVGPTGCGKTETFKLIADYANIPMTVVDCNQLTAEGFVGKSIDDVFKQIYATSNNDIKKAERSILMFDEIDKLASRGDPIKDLDVQQALLKVLEGHKYSFEHKKGSSLIELDTSFITKVGSGAFMDLFDKRKQKHSLGFNSVDEKLEEKTLSDKQIIDYGFQPEFVGRFPLIYTYRPLDEEGLKRVLKESKISPLTQIQERLIEEYGCNIEYDDDFLYEIVAEALKTEAGGRSLSKIITQSFIKLEGAMIDEVDLGHEIPKSLKLSREMIKNPNNFNL